MTWHVVVCGYLPECEGVGPCRLTTAVQVSLSEQVTEHEGVGSLQSSRIVALCGV